MRPLRFHPCQCITFKRLCKKEIEGIFAFHFVLSTLWNILGTAHLTLKVLYSWLEISAFLLLSKEILIWEHKSLLQ